MNPDNPVVQLCAHGMEAENQGDAANAPSLFLKAWTVAADDYEARIAAHYLARHQPTPEETLRWNQECLNRADRVGDERVRGFYASLHGNLGRAHLELGHHDDARREFEQAARHVDDAPPGQYGDWIRHCVAEGLRATRTASPDETEERIRALLTSFCVRQDLRALGLLLTPYLSDLGTPADRERIGTAARMLHAEQRLPEDEQTALSEVIALLPTGGGPVR